MTVPPAPSASHQPRITDSSSPLTETETFSPTARSMLFGVSAAIRTMPVPVVSIECITLSCSAGSSLAPYSLNRLTDSSPPNTER